MGPLPWRQRLQSLCDHLHISASSPTVDEDVSNAVDAVSSAQDLQEVQKWAFGNQDLAVLSSLEKGQFGKVEVVQCRLNHAVYARKCIQKSVANKFRDHVFIHSERELLLAATLTSTPWAPHLLAAFQTPDALHFVMDFAEGGNLWDILESAMDNRLLEDDLKWWVPQAVSAIGWCHEQGFAHRDIKPHNFVITRQAHLQLIDFGCAAPLLPSRSSSPQPTSRPPTSLSTSHPPLDSQEPSSKHRRAIPKPLCLVPIGTCDYISPEILQAHEDALYAAEMAAPRSANADGTPGAVEFGMDEEGYGCETDWWSLGAVIYELACGVAPFFAEHIKMTYERIVEHERSPIQFDDSLQLSSSFKDLVKRFLSNADERLGRSGVDEICHHAWFVDTEWSTLQLRHAPSTLHLPTCKTSHLDKISFVDDLSFEDESKANPFDFSHLFKSTPGTSRIGLSMSLASQQHFRRSGTAPPPVVANTNATSWPGFSWGPKADAFDGIAKAGSQVSEAIPLQDIANSLSASVAPNRNNQIPFATPAPPIAPTSFPTPFLLPPTTTLAKPANRPLFDVRYSDPGLHFSTSSNDSPGHNPYPFTTPIRPPLHQFNAHSTIPRTVGFSGVGTGTQRQRRFLSDREAMRQMMGCVGASARKKVLESGRKPRFISDSLRIKRPASALGLRAINLSAGAEDSSPPVAGDGANGPNDRASLRKAIPLDWKLNAGDITDSMIAAAPRQGQRRPSLSSASLAGLSRPGSSASLRRPPSTIPSLTLDQSTDSNVGNPVGGTGALGESTSGYTESIPESPTPISRPGSALSRRSASPYPYVVHNRSGTPMAHDATATVTMGMTSASASASGLGLGLGLAPSRNPPMLGQTRYASAPSIPQVPKIGANVPSAKGFSMSTWPGAGATSTSMNMTFATSSATGTTTNTYPYTSIAAVSALAAGNMVREKRPRSGSGASTSHMHILHPRPRSTSNASSAASVLGNQTASVTITRTISFSTTAGSGVLNRVIDPGPPPTFTPAFPPVQRSVPRPLSAVQEGAYVGTGAQPSDSGGFSGGPAATSTPVHPASRTKGVKRKVVAPVDPPPPPMRPPSNPPAPEFAPLPAPTLTSTPVAPRRPPVSRPPATSQPSKPLEVSSTSLSRSKTTSIDAPPPPHIPLPTAPTRVPPARAPALAQSYHSNPPSLDKLMAPKPPSAQLSMSVSSQSAKSATSRSSSKDTATRPLPRVQTATLPPPPSRPVVQHRSHSRPQTAGTRVSTASSHLQSRSKVDRPPESERRVYAYSVRRESAPYAPPISPPPPRPRSRHKTQASHRPSVRALSPSIDQGSSDLKQLLDELGRVEDDLRELRHKLDSLSTIPARSR